MKKNYTVKVFLLNLCLFLALQGVTQEKSPCGTDEAMDEYFSNNPEALKEKQAFEKYTQEFVARLQEERKNNPEILNRKAPAFPDYVIPVVFHIYGTVQNGKTVDDAVVIEAVNRTNLDWQGLRADWTQVSSAFDPIKQSLNIEFALAKLDPQGNPTSGIVYHAAKSGYGNGGGYDAQIAADAWDNYMYMNVYIQADLYADGGCCSSGVAWYPSTTMSNNNTARVVYNGQYLSTNSNDYNFADIVTHEFGHWLNLAHTFNNGCSGSGDNVADTPATTSNSGSCNYTNERCGGAGPPNGENFMDYTTCYRMFTQGQIDRVTAALNHASRYPLWQLSNLQATGLEQLVNTDIPPVADFSYTNTALCAGNTVDYSDLSSGGAVVTRTWTFPGGTPSTSSSADVTVTYDTPGVYSVTLDVSNSFGSDSKSMTDLISVGTSTPLPYSQGFEGASFPPAGWTVLNPDNTIEWEQRTDVGSNGSAKTMAINNADNATTGAIDEVILEPFDLFYTYGNQMTFDIAYTGFDANSPDQLRVYASGDCGTTWTEVYMKTHTDLKTYPTDGSYLTDAAEKNDWKPTTQAHWREETVDLTAFDGNSYVMIKFHNTSGYGTWIYTDNINISGITGDIELPMNKLILSVYPNPSNNIFNVSLNSLEKENYTIEITNTIGQIIVNDNLSFEGKQLMAYDLSEESNGVYILTVKNSKGQLTKKLIKQ